MKRYLDYRARQRPWARTFGAVAWYEADHFVNVGAQTWSDINGRNALSLAAGSAWPTWVSDDGDGKPALRFNGTTNYLERTGFAPLDLDNDFTIVSVIRPDAADDGISWCFGRESLEGRVHLRNISGSFWEPQMISQSGAGFDYGKSVPGGMGDRWNIAYVRRAGATFFCASGDLTEASGAVPSGTFTAQTLTVGAAKTSAGSYVLLYAGRVRSLALFNRSLNPDELRRLRAFWRTKWPAIL